MGRSSSFFFQGLIEGHPKIITLPLVHNILNIKYKGKEINKLVSEIYNFLKESYSFYDIKIEKHLKLKDFKKDLEKYFNAFGINKKSIFIGIHYASLKNKKEIKYILYHSHTLSILIDVLKTFNNPLIIFTTRDPRTNHLSYIKMRYKIGSFIQKVIYSFYKKIKSKNVLVVKHEDIHLNYPFLRRKLLNFLKINDSKTLDYSTMFGIPFNGIKTHSSYLNINDCYPNKKYVNDDWKKELSSRQIKFIQQIYSCMMKEFDYKKIEIKIEDIYFLGTKYKLPKLTKNQWHLKKSIIRIVYFLEKDPIVGRTMIKISYLLNELVFIYLKMILKVILFRKKIK